MTTALLWSASFVNNYTSITLNDSIDNYDEIHYYGSATRDTHIVNNITEYPVVPGTINQGGPFYCGKWSMGDLWLLCNGTQCWLSGTSGYVNSSYFWGNGNTTATLYGAGKYNNRADDLRPYMIVGVKYDN